MTDYQQSEGITAGMTLPILFAHRESALLHALEMFRSKQAVGVVYFDDWPGKPGCMFIRVYLQPKHERLRERLIRDAKEIVKDLGFVALNGEPRGAS